MKILLLVFTVSFLFSNLIAARPTKKYDLAGRVWGGISVEEHGEIPYQLSLRFNDQHFCGGSLINVMNVTVGLTAAHCHIFDDESVTVVAGDVTLSDTSSFEQIRLVKATVIHPQFNIDFLNDDIALIFFESPFVINSYVSPISLPEFEQETTGFVTVSGWGIMDETEASANTLQKVTLPIIDYDDCLRLWDFDYRLRISKTFCAGSIGKGVCRGDSGGPAVSITGQYVAGIVSWGRVCSDRITLPDVYTEVSHYVDWIYKTVQEYKKDIRNENYEI